jgi:hypothetical protein
MSAQTSKLAMALFKFVQQQDELEFHAQNPATAERWELLAEILAPMLKQNEGCKCEQCVQARRFLTRINT